MAGYRIISADSHIVEPPDMYTARFDPKLRNRAPHMERRKTPAGREYDAWMLEGQQVGTLGAVMQAGQRFEDPSQIDFLGVWEDVRKGAYHADAMIVVAAIGMRAQAPLSRRPAPEAMPNAVPKTTLAVLRAAPGTVRS